MRVRAVLLLGALAAVAAALPARAVQGEVFVQDGQSVLRVWGTHAERGYAAGYLLGDETVKLLREYLLQLIPPVAYNALAASYGNVFTTPPEFVEEATAYLEGAEDALGSLHVAELGRDLALVDLAITSSLPDALVFAGAAGPACSSIAAWGSATGADPELAGGLAAVRNLEWSDTPDHKLSQATLIVVSIPAEPAEQAWVSAGFPGMWGTLSGMNAAGVSVTLNVGNHQVSPSVPPLCDPLAMTLRRALEARDFDGDGSASIADLEAAVQNSHRATSVILHAGMPALGAVGQPSLVLEVNAAGFAVRQTADDPVVAPDFLLATNHHRVLYDPVSCNRYTRLQELVTADREVTTGELMASALDVRQASWIYTLITRPDRLDLAVSHKLAGGASGPMVTFTWEELVPEGSPTPATPTPTPAASPPPPTASPAPSPTAALQLGVRLELPAWIRPGEEFGVTAWLDNPGPPLSEVPVVCVLEVYGDFWFWPGWSHFRPPDQGEVDFEIHDLDVGSQPLEIVPEFVWPDTGPDSITGLFFHGALLGPGLDELLGTPSSIEWGYGPTP